MTLFGFTVEWLQPGLRPNYRRDPLMILIRDRSAAFTGQWFAVWIGDRIRIGRTR